jgi:hypothetical protein
LGTAASAATKGTVAAAVTYPKAPARFYEVIERARAEILSRITETRWARIAGEVRKNGGGIRGRAWALAAV